jgi:hypothetical protein
MALSPRPALNARHTRDVGALQKTHTDSLPLAGQAGTPPGTEVHPAGELRPYLTAVPAGAFRVKTAGGAQDA